MSDNSGVPKTNRGPNAGTHICLLVDLATKITTQLGDTSKSAVSVKTLAWPDLRWKGMSSDQVAGDETRHVHVVQHFLRVLEYIR